jgi:protein PhnA
MSDDDYIYDEESGEWISAEQAREKAAQQGGVVVRDAVGNVLAMATR